MTPDLDALAALLAAATERPAMDFEVESRRNRLLDAVIPTLPALIEAARREAALTEALIALLPLASHANHCYAGGTAGLPCICGYTEVAERARALLHDNAGAAAALPAEGTE